MTDSLIPSSRKKKIITFLIHFLCISILFILPEVISSLNRPFNNGNDVWKIALYSKSILYVAVFYINYYFIIKKYIKAPGEWVRFFGYNLIVIAVSLIAIFFLWRAMKLSGHHRHSFEDLSLWQQFIRGIPFLVRDLVMLILTIALSLALKLSDSWIRLEKHRQELLSIRREDELNSLKSQLNPHFLFNTLNTIYALIAISPDKAQNAVHELSRLLRYVLYENPDRVTLAREVDFVKNYVALMKLRLGETPVILHTDCRNSNNVYVPPLIFIAIIENAFKYGNTGNAHDTISITITCDGDTVTCNTLNSYDPSIRQSGSSGGIGLTNLRRRLQLIYGSDASLSTIDNNNTFTVRLSIRTNNQ